MKNKTRKIIIWTLVTLLLLGLTVGGVGMIYAGAEYSGPETRVNIPSGATSREVRDILESSLGTYGARVYGILRLREDAPIVIRGSYVVAPGEKALYLARRIMRGRQNPVRVTFNNLRTFNDLAGRLAQKLEADSADFIAAADSVFAPAGFAPEEYAAAVLPDTYEFYWTASASQVLEKLLSTRNQFWNEERTAAAESLGLTPPQVATVASIVEEESNKADERPVIARLYLNRLDRGMLLQADPTVKFAIGDFSLRRITAAHLGIDSPYNTYKYAGLPPGPVRIVERATLEAVLNAPQNDYLYMCAKPDFSGYHDFTNDYNRHRINAARYHRALSARGISE